jgi:Planctomycete cytochrome C
MNQLTVSKFFLRSLVLVLFINLLQSCKHEPSDISNLQPVCFDTQILSILGACTQCHSGNSHQGGFDPSNYNSVMKSVKPGNPWGSKLYTIVSSPNNPNMMPPKGHNPLSITQRTTIEVWILQGAKETKCDTIH